MKFVIPSYTAPDEPLETSRIVVRDKCGEGVYEVSLTADGSLEVRGLTLPGTLAVLPRVANVIHIIPAPR